MLESFIVFQSEVIRAILSEDSPYCGVPHLRLLLHCLVPQLLHLRSHLLQAFGVAALFRKFQLGPLSRSNAPRSDMHSTPHSVPHHHTQCTIQCPTQCPPHHTQCPCRHAQQHTQPQHANSHARTACVCLIEQADRARTPHKKGWRGTDRLLEPGVDLVIRMPERPMNVNTNAQIRQRRTQNMAVPMGSQGLFCQWSSASRPARAACAAAASDAASARCASASSCAATSSARSASAASLSAASFASATSASSWSARICACTGGPQGKALS